MLNHNVSIKQLGSDDATLLDVDEKVFGAIGVSGSINLRQITIIIISDKKFRLYTFGSIDTMKEFFASMRFDAMKIDKIYLVIHGDLLEVSSSKEIVRWLSVRDMIANRRLD